MIWGNVGITLYLGICRHSFPKYVVTNWDWIHSYRDSKGLWNKGEVVEYMNNLNF